MGYVNLLSAFQISDIPITEGTLPGILSFEIRGSKDVLQAGTGGSAAWPLL